MDGKSQANEIRIVTLYQGPIDSSVKQVRDRLELAPAAGTIQFESLPGPDAWQELDAKQRRQAEDVGRLAMRIGIESGRMDFTERIMKNVEDVSRLVYSTPDEAAEKGNVIIGDVPIGDSARPAVAKVSRCHQIISEGLEMGTIRCSRLSPPPQLRQIEPEKKVLQVSGPARRFAISMCRLSTKLNSSGNTATPK